MNTDKRNICEIAPLLAPQFVDFTPDIEVLEDYYELIRNRSKQIGTYAKYLQRLHDSLLHEVEVGKEHLRITLDDRVAEMYAEALLHKKDVPTPTNGFQFPIEIDYKFSKISFFKVDEAGDLEPTEQVLFQEYLYEQVLSVNENQIELALVVWRDLSSRMGERLLLLLTLDTIRVRELQTQAWTAYFGSAFEGYYTYFESVRNTERFITTDEQCEILIDEHDYINQLN